MQAIATSFNATVAHKARWKDQSWIFQGAFLALCLECEFFGVWQLFSTKITAFLSLHNKRLFVRNHAYPCLSLANDHAFVTFDHRLRWRLDCDLWLLWLMHLWLIGEVAPSTALGIEIYLIRLASTQILWGRLLCDWGLETKKVPYDRRESTYQIP